MTLRKLQALILSYRGSDAATRGRILKLVPELAELVEDVDSVPRWQLTIAASAEPDKVRGSMTVACAEEHLEERKRVFAASHQYLHHPIVTATTGVSRCYNFTIYFVVRRG